LTGEAWLISSKLGSVDHVGDSLPHLNSTGRISKAEVAAPEIVRQQELDLEISRFADSLSYAEIAACREWAC
jgi:hypothetical protein